MAQDGRPAARLALVEIIALVDDIPGAKRNPPGPDRRPSWTLDGALITEEPGAQLEVAGPPEPDAHQAVKGVEAVVQRLSSAFVANGAALAAAGLDCWSSDAVPVQLDIPRYGAMSSYFRRRGEDAGRLLMCSSCSLQINVDLGPPDVASRRWLLANLAAPVFTAAFATSPGARVVNARALGWQGLDPTRTGVSPALVSGEADPAAHVLVDVLRADVMLVERDGVAHAGRPGWTFEEWLVDGHETFGPPTDSDLQTHLTTLFPEARLRGFIEVRSIDELPTRWRGAAVALVVGLLYDEQAREAALDVLTMHRPELPELLLRAARHGLADPVVGPLTSQVLDEGEEGARRLGLPEAEAAAAFLDHFTARGRHPSDDLRAALAHGPAEAFGWARS